MLTIPSAMAAYTPITIDAHLVDNIRHLIEEREDGMLLNLLTDLYPVDIASLMERLQEREARYLFLLLPDEQRAEVLVELEPAWQEKVLQGLSAETIADLLDELDTDDAADLVAELPDTLRDQVLPELEDEEEVRELLAYDEETAGGIMGTEYVVVSHTATIEEATEAVRAHAEWVDPLHTVFVVDEEKRLVGQLPLKTLLLYPGHTPVREVMQRDLVTALPHVDQEDVARLMEKYDLVVLPVVDEQERLIGRITIDDVVDVIREEVEEDLSHISGTGGDEELSDSLFKVSRGRLPWLLLGLVGTLLSGLVVNFFQGSLQQAVVLATFIPVMTAMAGNAAIQSSAITVQGLASGKLWQSDLLKRLVKEMGVAFVNGGVLALLLVAAISFMGLGGDHTLQLSLTAGCALFSVILLATTNGALIPVLLHRLGIDPAVSMGPFVTTANDILGLAVYFTIATLLFLG